MKAIPLTYAGLAQLTAASGGSLAIGGTPSGLGGNFAFGGTDVGGARLVIELGLIPVPALRPPLLGVLSLLLVGSAVFVLRHQGVS